jgi:lysozyme
MVDRQKVRDHVGRQEGFRPVRYWDTAGKMSIGKGFNLDAPGAADRCARVGLDYEALRNGAAITEEQADLLMDEGITVAQDAALVTVVGFMDLPENVQLVVIDMLFNMGRDKFLKFHKMIDALEAHDWRRMVSEMRASLWYGEVGTRALEDIALVLSAVTAV